ncbi:hypothetical protein [Labrenzia sp. DG1229]|nr:hypothetical protein [Labrenzia sp. DG1229]
MTGSRIKAEHTKVLTPETGEFPAEVNQNAASGCKGKTFCLTHAPA